jgi:hypothetical protein
VEYLYKIAEERIQKAQDEGAFDNTHRGGAPPLDLPRI